MEAILNTFKITEVYNHMPLSFNLADYLKKGTIPITISRKEHETLDQVKKRTVYSIVGKVSHPIIVNGEFIGECHVEDMYGDSNYRRFYQNLQLHDPNILILQCSGNRRECSEIKIFNYVFNILKKYSNYPYRRRMCIRYLSPIITSEYDKNSFGVRWEDPVPAQILSESLRISDPNKLAEALLNEDGINERSRVVAERQEEDSYNRMMADEQANESDWQDCSKAEMDYIRNNGGDWIDD